MSKQVVLPAGWRAPAGYSHAVKTSGTPLFIAGQVSVDSSGSVVGEGDINAQTQQVMRNLQSVVEAAGGTLNDIVKITVYVTDIAYRPAVAAARQQFFTEGNYPASTFLVIAALAQPQFLVEIEAVAVLS